MKRIFTSSLAFALCFSTFAHGQEVVWKSIGNYKPIQPAQPTQSPVAQPAVAQVPVPQAPVAQAPVALPPIPQPAPVTQVGAVVATSAAPQPPIVPPATESVIVPDGQVITEDIPAPKPVVPGVPTPMPTPAPIVSPGRVIITSPPTTQATVPHSVEPVPQGSAPPPSSGMSFWPLSSILPECAACESGSTIISSEVVSGNRFFLSAEALFWWTRGANGPVLATTGPLTSEGIIGAPGVTTALTTSDLDQQFRPGVRIKGGWWFDPCQIRGIDSSAFYLPSRTGSYRGSSNDLSNLYRPFFVLNNGFAPIGNRPGEFSELVFTQPVVLGQLSADLKSTFWGADVNYRRNWWSGCTTRVDGIAGFRYLNLSEKLTINENIRPQVPVGYGAFRLPAGSVLSVTDQFQTRNDFYGGQVGADIEFRRNRWTLDMRPVVAFGASREQLNITGSQTVSPAQFAPPGAFNGGLYALSSNIGQYNRQQFAIVPEMTFNVGYDFGCHWKVFAGYNFLYWSNVIRPGDQIDRNLDVTRIPNFLRPNENVPAVAGNHPGVPFNDSQFWAQGGSVGLEYRW